MSTRTALLALLVLLSATACRRRPGPPSREYERARGLRVALLARYADEADARPEMDEVLSLLDRVAPDSVDAPAAGELEGRILEARKRLAAEAAERERRVAAAVVPPPISAASRASGSGGAVPDARPRLAPGLELGEFRAAYEDCFESRTRLAILGVDGGVMDPQGEAWGLKADPDCRERYPGMAESLVLFASGALVAVRPTSEMVRIETRRTVEFLPDGGYRPLEGPGGDGGRP